MKDLLPSISVRNIQYSHIYDKTVNKGEWSADRNHQAVSKAKYYATMKSCGSRKVTVYK